MLIRTGSQRTAARPWHLGYERGDPVRNGAHARYRNRAAEPRGTESVLFPRSFSHGEAPIRFLGVLDTVGALGIPLSRNPLTAVFNRPLT